ncbi:MAG: FadR family transcriptional regulator [Chloroflexi bacterium]|nr:FadR family transcriptional regulator [Chloroflexota bacterium]
MGNSSQFNSLQHYKLGDQISRQLLWAIADGRYSPGDRLPAERDLAQMFSASRVVVREAIGQLNARGIVSVQQGIGTTVNPINKWNSLDPEVFFLLHIDQAFKQLIEVRRIIEPESAYLAAQRVTDEQLLKLRPLSVLSLEDTQEQHVERDTEFHLEIARAAQNDLLLVIFSSISNLLRESRRYTYSVSSEIPKGNRCHQEILAAIELRDAEGARRAMNGHLDQTEDVLEKWRIEHKTNLTVE